MKIALNH
jgi:hypothetical protein